MILHISNGFAQSDLYKNLFYEIDKSGIEQVIYSAVRTKEEATYLPKELNHLEIHVKNILSKWDRIFFRRKVKRVLNDLMTNVKIATVKVIHAHTLYSDGAIAYKLKEQLGIPYVVSVRSTDINIFEKYRFDLSHYRNCILKEASKVIFISPSYKNKLLNLLPISIRREVNSKSLVIPNGIDEEFFFDTPVKNNPKDNTLRILYVGDFRPLKNVPNLIKAVDILKDKIPVRLTIVGSGGEYEDNVLENIRAKNLLEIVDLKGRVTNKAKLKKIYSEHDVFAMVSKPETFGLVYIEALSQGTPIIYTEGEGVDGYFDSLNVGEKVSDVNNPEKIAEAILKLYNRTTIETSRICIKVSEEFNWETISKRYIQYYREFL